MKLTLCGDVCPVPPNYEEWIRGDANVLFNDVVEIFEVSDRTIVNLECALTESENGILKKGPNLKGPLNTARVLKEVGVTDCGLSNNHVFDYGIEGLRDTVRALGENGLNYTGIGKDEVDARKNLIIEHDGKKVAIVAVCEHEYTYAISDRMGARAYDPYDTHEDIRKAKENADFVVVMYHGGKEYCEYPSPRLRKLCQAMVRDGADVVLCQHSHCLGCYENYEGGHILYGQGNFHFLPRAEGATPSWLEGLAVRLDIEGDNLEFSLIPTVVEGKGIRLAKGIEKDEMLEAISKRSENLHNGIWLEKWREFCEAHREPYTNGVRNAYSGSESDLEVFAHYLDCEAHTDVWRELYKTLNHTNEKG